MEKYFEEWNGEKYPVRVVPFDEDYWCGSPIKVASSLLWDVMVDAYEQGDKKAVAIDDEIFCYCDPEFIAKDPTDEAIRKYVIEFIL